MSLITLNQNYGYTPYKISNLAAGSVIDATNASWIVDNSSIDFPDATHSTTSGTGALNTYPFKVDGAGLGLLIKGGAIWGQVPQQSDWQYTYNNSAAIRVANTPGVIIDDWRLDGTWDAIRIASGATNFLIDDTWITNVRDDAVENDYVLGGTIRDSLFDGVFSGISLGDSDHYDGSMNTLTLDGLMMRNKPYLFEGKVTHETPFKCDTGAPGTTPDIRIDNSVIAIEDVNHAGQKRLQIAWDHVVESHGNVFLNLSDVPLPSTYPKPPAGFTILQGQQARDYWEACKTAWHANHDGVNDAGVTALPPLPGTSPTTPPPPVPPAPDPGTTNAINGTSGNDKLYGTSANDLIKGLAGNDNIYGKGGADVLSGGTGQDKFIFDTSLDGKYDKIIDFNPVDDNLYFNDAIFKTIGSGSWSHPSRMNSSYFVAEAGATAHDANDHILYDTQSGMMSYDPDGTGPATAIAFLQLSTGLAITSADIFVI
jgi:Ca2+-binding RTX toxin-like protein